MSIEKKLEDDKLITFTPNTMQYMNESNFENIHPKEIEKEIIDKLVERDTKMEEEQKGDDDNR